MPSFQQTKGTSTIGRENVIRIGMTAPLTGPASESGIALSQGATLAVAEINAAGGVELNGREYRVELLVEDCESEPEVGVSAAEKLITQDKVHYLIGDALHSSVTMAIMDLAPKYGIPIVSGESVSEAIVEKVKVDPERYRYYWKMNFGSTAYAHVVFNMVEWLVEKGGFQPHTQRVFFIVEDTDYGRSNALVAAKSFEGIGWSAAGIETVPLDHTEFQPQLDKLRDAEADVLISIFTPVASGAALVRQIQASGVEGLHIAIYSTRVSLTSSSRLAVQQKACFGLRWTLTRNTIGVIRHLPTRSSRIFRLMPPMTMRLAMTRSTMPLTVSAGLAH